MELAALSAADLKERLPIVYVLDRYHIPVEDVGGRYAAVCPFHPDRDPSLDIYGERLERWGCFPCGAKGDVLDLVARLAWPSSTPDFRTVRDYAVVLLAEFEASDWSGPTEGVVRAFNPEQARAIVAQSSLRRPGPVEAFLDAKWAEGKLRGVSVATLTQTWRVGSRLEEIIIPYFDRDDELVTYKHRTAETKALSAPGSSLGGVLYGEWLDTDTSRPVLLTEGESDAWAARASAGDLWSVLGAPTGASDTRTAGLLGGRRVTVAFDGDAAGRSGALLWYGALGPGTRIIEVPDGVDLADMAPADLRSLLSR